MSKLGHYIPKTQGQYMPKVVARLACHTSREGLMLSQIIKILGNTGSKCS